MGLVNIHFFFVLACMFIMYKNYLALQPFKLLQGLWYWVPPSTEEIEELVPGAGTVFANKNKLKKAMKGKKKALVLRQDRVVPRMFQSHQFYEQFEGMLFVVGLALASFSFGELWTCTTDAPHSEYSFLLIAIVLAYIYSCMVSVVVGAGYWTEQTKVALGAAVFSGLAAGLVLLQFDPYLDFSIDKWTEFLKEVSASLAKNVDIHSKLDMSSNVYIFFLSLACALLGVIMAWPVYWHSKTYDHIKSPRYWVTLGSKERKAFSKRQVLRWLCHLDHYWSLVVSLFWVLPLTKDYAVHPDSLITSDVFDTGRLVLVIVGVALRACVFQTHAQAFLSLRLGPCTIDKTKANHIQRHLTSLLLCLPSFALEYWGITAGSLILSLMLKRKGLLCWGICSVTFGGGTAVNDPASTTGPFAAFFENVFGINSTLALSAFQAPKEVPTITLINNPLMVTSISFVLWWGHVIWFAYSVFFQLYHDRTGAKSLIGQEETQPEQQEQLKESLPKPVGRKSSKKRQ